MTNQEAIKILDNLKPGDYSNPYEKGEAIMMAISALQEQERKKGKWIRITQGAIPEIYMCPFCNRTVKDSCIDDLVQIRYPFCHCGADMRE